MATSRIARLRQTLASLLPRTTVRTNQTAYYSLGNSAIGLYEELDRTRASQAGARAEILFLLSTTETAMADAYRAGWSAHPDDAVIAAETAVSGQLLRLLGSTEECTDPAVRLRGEEAWETAFGPVLDALTGATDIRRRAELTTRLYLDAQPVVGDAAETISRVHLAYLRAALNSPSAASDTTEASA